MVGASLLGYLGTPLLVHRMAASLWLVAGTGVGYLFTFLSGDIMANLPGYLSLHLILYSLTVLLGIVPGHLFVFSFALLSVFSLAALLGNLITFLPWDILALLPRNILAVLSWHLLAHLSGLSVALLAGNNRGHWLLNLLALAYRNRTAYRLVDSGALLIILIISVGNLYSLAVLFGYIHTVLLGDLLAGGSRFIPALLSGFIPTFLLAIHVAAFFLYNS